MWLQSAGMASIGFCSGAHPGNKGCRCQRFASIMMLCSCASEILSHLDDLQPQSLMAQEFKCKLPWKAINFLVSSNLGQAAWRV